VKIQKTQVFKPDISLIIQLFSPPPRTSQERKSSQDTFLQQRIDLRYINGVSELLEGILVGESIDLSVASEGSQDASELSLNETRQDVGPASNSGDPETDAWLFASEPTSNKIIYFLLFYFTVRKKFQGQKFK